MKLNRLFLAQLVLCLCVFTGALSAQSNEFTYQGRLLDNSLPPTANYDFEFSLWDASTTPPGTQLGTTQTQTGVAVANGIFTVKLNFGGEFPGAARFLQIAVRPSLPPGGTYTTLSPRQPITSSPYSIKSASSTSADGLSATCVLCVTDGQILSIDGAKVMGTVANATNAVNATTATSATTAGNVTGVVAIANGGTGSPTKNFVDLSTDQTSIGGNKTFTGTLSGNIISATTQFDIGGNRILSNPSGGNLFVGVGTGPNATGTLNSFFGTNAGLNHTSGASNSFFGTNAGRNVLNFGGNSFFGANAGSTASGCCNSFFGTNSGMNTQNGSSNAFFGRFSGLGNITGSNNTLVGASTNVGAGDLAYATAIGADAVVSSSNTLVLGRPADSVQIPGNLNITGSFAGKMRWQVQGDIIGDPPVADVNTGYIFNGDFNGIIKLPASPNVGDTVRFAGAGLSGWKIVQNDGQSVLLTGLGLLGSNWTAHLMDTQWSAVASSADGSKLVAAINGSAGALFTSADSGQTWEQHGPGVSWQTLASSADGTKLVGGVCCSANFPGFLYTSTDSGQTWTSRAFISSWQSVASSADGVKLIAANKGGKLYTSTDSGVTWNPHEQDRLWWSVASSADGTKLVGVVNGERIYTSTDSGVSWTPHESNRSWNSVASSADGTKLVASGNNQIFTSTDSGVTWTPRASGPWDAVTSSADGTRLVAVQHVDDGKIYASADSGVTWAPIGPSRRFGWHAIASSADGTKLVAGTVFGQVYTSSGSLKPTTTVGATGYLLGSPFSYIELVYIGGGFFLPLSHAGDVTGY